MSRVHGILTLVRTYTWKVSVIPQGGYSNVEKVFEIANRDNSVKKKTHEVWKRKVRNAIGGPWTVMIHLGNTSDAELAYSHDSAVLQGVSRQIWVAAFNTLHNGPKSSLTSFRKGQDMVELE